MKLSLVSSFFIIITTVHAAETNRTEKDDGFYSYVSAKGIPISKISENTYRLSHLKWNCDIDTSVAKHFIKQNISWKDMFETRLEMLREKTIFSPDELREKHGVLPLDGRPVTLVARQGNVIIPKENVIIRLNNHGALDARTTMVVMWPSNIWRLSKVANKQPEKEIIYWYGLWNTSRTLVIPEVIWNLKRLKYYRGPLLFLKGKYLFGNLAKCNPRDGVGLAALNRIAHLKGDISTLGFSTGLTDSYNLKYRNRFELLVHKLAWSYFVVKELTDILQSKQKYQNS